MRVRLSWYRMCLSDPYHCVGGSWELGRELLPIARELERGLTPLLQSASEELRQSRMDSRDGGGASVGVCTDLFQTGA